jgi:hypothetical protein
MSVITFSHSAYALLMMFVVGFPTGNWLAGAMLGCGFFIGREHAQAEYRAIEKYYNGKRAGMPEFEAFKPRNWDIKSILDFVLPIIATLSAVVIINVLMRSIRVS